MGYQIIIHFINALQKHLFERKILKVYLKILKMNFWMKLYSVVLLIFYDLVSKSYGWNLKTYIITIKGVENPWNVTAKDSYGDAGVV